MGNVLVKSPHEHALATVRSTEKQRQLILEPVLSPTPPGCPPDMAADIPLCGSGGLDLDAVKRQWGLETCLVNMINFEPSVSHQTLMQRHMRQAIFGLVFLIHLACSRSIELVSQCLETDTPLPALCRRFCRRLSRIQARCKWADVQDFLILCIWISLAIAWFGGYIRFAPVERARKWLHFSFRGLELHFYLVSQGWTGSGNGLRQGAIARPLAIPQKKTLAGLGKDRDEAFPFWDHLFSAASKSIQINISSDDDGDGDDSDAKPSTSISLRRTDTGILSNLRPVVGASAASSGTTTPEVEDASARLSLLATAKREAARRGLYSRFFRGPILGPASDAKEPVAVLHAVAPVARPEDADSGAGSLYKKKRRTTVDAEKDMRRKRKRLEKARKELKRQEESRERMESEESNEVASSSDPGKKKEKRKLKQVQNVDFLHAGQEQSHKKRKRKHSVEKDPGRGELSMDVDQKRKRGAEKRNPESNGELKEKKRKEKRDGEQSDKARRKEERRRKTERGV
ncbi:hypothetical protein GGX14DRAFT_621256 [Mycena pura]|uniref:Uncharacterized protein n=1 Tax=Mycena pura TaxID=153505 RepID=A0AAD6VGB5_9AGAR|nr:hypothetical protein GGX14DRAFT_621256 [Mycena pura]